MKRCRCFRPNAQGTPSPRERLRGLVDGLERVAGERAVGKGSAGQLVAAQFGPIQHVGNRGTLGSIGWGLPIDSVVTPHAHAQPVPLTSRRAGTGDRSAGMSSGLVAQDRHSWTSVRGLPTLQGLATSVC